MMNAQTGAEDVARKTYGPNYEKFSSYYAEDNKAVSGISDEPGKLSSH
jgi:hypothetical protein